MGVYADTPRSGTRMILPFLHYDYTTYPCTLRPVRSTAVHPGHSMETPAVISPPLPSLPLPPPPLAPSSSWTDSSAVCRRTPPLDRTETHSQKRKREREGGGGRERETPRVAISMPAPRSNTTSARIKSTEEKSCLGRSKLLFPEIGGDEQGSKDEDGRRQELDHHVKRRPRRILEGVPDGVPRDSRLVGIAALPSEVPQLRAGRRAEGELREDRSGGEQRGLGLTWQTQETTLFSGVPGAGVQRAA